MNNSDQSFLGAVVSAVVAASIAIVGWFKYDIRDVRSQFAQHKDAVTIGIKEGDGAVWKVVSDILLELKALTALVAKQHTEIQTKLARLEERSLQPRHERTRRDDT